MMVVSDGEGRANPLSDGPNHAADSTGHPVMRSPEGRAPEIPEPAMVDHVPVARRFMPDAIHFRPVAMADVPLLTRWLNRPHVRAFYQLAPITETEVADEYGLMIGGEAPDICHLALMDDEPFGYIQCYRNRDYPGWAELIEVGEGISLDLFIGEAAFLGRGIGQAFLRRYLAEVAFPHFADESRAYIAHDVANGVALRCSQAIGFRPLRTFIEDGGEVLLHVLERADLAEGARELAMEPAERA
jgi:aminoglycoside 6'-N-acetyltransferase